ncbi:hypothetical protein QJQ45_029500 [Haematococcus lacustris]|nr:hypothetical protein QJQ45_029500 [Haematococcus lacustris]
MSDAGMLGVLTEEGVTSLKKFRNGALPDPAEPGKFIEGPKDGHIMYTDGVAISVIFLRPKPAAPPVKLPRMGRHMGAVNPLAHLDAEWLGVDPGKANMATVAHEERSAGQYYRDSSITRQTQATKTWLAQPKLQLNALSHVSSKPSSLASYRRFADTVLATYDAMRAEVSKPRWANAKFRGVPVSQMLKEALRQFPAGRVLMVDEVRTSRVAAASVQQGEAFYGRDVSAALNIRRCAAGPGPRPTELCR